MIYRQPGNNIHTAGKYSYTPKIKDQRLNILRTATRLGRDVILRRHDDVVFIFFIIIVVIFFIIIVVSVVVANK